MNIVKALASLTEIISTIDLVTAQIKAVVSMTDSVAVQVTTAVELITLASQEKRDITDAELQQIIARADLSRVSLEAALAG